MREAERQGGLLSVSPLGFVLTSGAVRFVASYSDGNVHNAVGLCGANGPCVRQNRVVLAVVATVKLLRMRHLRQPAQGR